LDEGAPEPSQNSDDSPVPTYSAARILLAPRDDVWEFLSEPTRLADWWPGIQGVHADRRGLAPGARWQIQTRGRTNLLVGPKMSVEGMIVIIDVVRPERIAWQFVHDRYDVEVRLDERGEARTLVELIASAPLFGGLRRSLPRRALTRLYALCQTGAQE
jgi:uncharacterized protein YndB with AHSA1/START domain